MMNKEILENLKKAIIEYNAEEAANLAKKAVEEKIGPVKRLDAMTVANSIGADDMILRHLVQYS